MVEWVDPSTMTIPTTILKLVPASVAHQDLVVPIRKEGDALIIAIENPFDEEALTRLRFIMNQEVILVGSTRSKLKCAVWRNYGPRLD